MDRSEVLNAKLTQIRAKRRAEDIQKHRHYFPGTLRRVLLVEYERTYTRIHRGPEWSDVLADGSPEAVTILGETVHDELRDFGLEKEKFAKVVTYLAAIEPPITAEQLPNFLAGVGIEQD